MHAGESYTAHSPWLPTRPETLVVCCSDGRWHAAIGEYVDHFVSEHADLYAVPGGPAAFDPWNSSFEEARVLESALAMFAEYHDLHSAWLIQHEGCAYYRAKHPAQSDEWLIQRQKEDLRRARELLTQRYPYLSVRLVYAGLEEGRVVFTTVDTASHRAR